MSAAQITRVSTGQLGCEELEAAQHAHLMMNRSPRPWSNTSSGGQRLSEQPSTIALGFCPDASCEQAGLMLPRAPLPTVTRRAAVIQGPAGQTIISHGCHATSGTAAHTFLTSSASGLQSSSGSPCAADEQTRTVSGH